MNSKRIIFVRHGESFDDVFNEYGSWSNRELTPQGILTAFDVVTTVKRLPSFDIIYTSPLKRASQTASILGEQLELRVEEDHYLIERNTYGLLAGVNRDLANEKYPEMNAAVIDGGYIHGAEKYSDFKFRTSKLVSRLLENEFKSIICVTHGYVITEIIDNYTDQIRNSISNGLVIELIWDGGDVSKKAKIGFVDGVTFTEDPVVVQSLEKRKFTAE